MGKNKNKTKKNGRKITIPILAVAVTISYLYLTTIFIFTHHWFGLSSSLGFLNAVVFTLVTAMCIFCYLVAVFTDPGRVPPTFMPDTEHPLDLESDHKSADSRYCQKCSHYKPPRAHHCRVCKSCVLRMDHHCIWIDNCVGHANYKIFFVFVSYAVVACLYSVVLLLGSILKDYEKDEPQISRTIYVISCLLMFPLTIALVVLLFWHVYLTIRNKTTIEYYQGARAMWLAAKEGVVYKHPYDLGAFENLTLILGPNILSWMFPTTRHVGSGLHFPTVSDKLTQPESE